MTSSKPPPKRIVVTGASRGIGLEFARQWCADGRTVFALARDPAGAAGLQALLESHSQTLVPIACDVSSEESVRAAAEEVAERTDAIDLLVNNAAIYGKQRVAIDELIVDKVLPVFEVNALGPLRVTQAFLPLLRRGENPRIVHLTSLMGSIADNSSGRSYAYRMSKAALNIASKSIAVDLADAGITSNVLHPGWVATDMGGPRARISVEEATASMIRTIEALTREQSGAFFDREGQPLPW